MAERREHSNVSAFLRHKISKLDGGRRKTESFPIFIRLAEGVTDTSEMRRACPLPFHVFGNIAVTEANAETIGRLAQRADVDYVNLPPLGQPTREDTLSVVKATAEDIGHPERTGEGVLIGIIDTGLDYLNPQFEDQDGNSRIRHLGIQEQGSGQIRGYDWPAKLQHPARLPEREQAGGHGTRVAGIAAGRSGVAHGSEIIAVQTTYYAPHIPIAVEYIFAQARALNRRVVVNLSMEFGAGPHDGTSELDICLWNLLQRYPEHVIVAATGNRGHQTHVGGVIQPGELATIELQELSGEPAFELWLTNADGVTVNRHDAVEMSACHIGRCKSGSICFMPPKHSCNEIITLHNQANEPVMYHGWLYGSGKLKDGNSDYTVTSPATAYGVIAVGAMQSNHQVAEHSGRGPTVNGRQKPDVVAPGWTGAFENHIPPANARASTSWAAPYVTGAVALMLQGDPPMPQAEVRCGSTVEAPEVKHRFWNIAACLRKSARLPLVALDDPNNGSTGFANSWGRGILDVNAALDCEDSSPMPKGPEPGPWAPAEVCSPCGREQIGAPSQIDPGWGHDFVIAELLARFTNVAGVVQELAVASVKVERNARGAGIERWHFFEGAGEAMLNAQQLVITTRSYDEPYAWPPAQPPAAGSGEPLLIPTDVDYVPVEPRLDEAFEMAAGGNPIRLHFAMGGGDVAQRIGWYRSDGQEDYLLLTEQTYVFNKLAQPDWQSHHWTAYIWS